MKSKKKIVLIVVSSILLLLLFAVGGVYFYGVSRYQSQFLRGTRINGIDCSDMAPSDVCTILDSQISDYTLEVSGRDPRNPEEKALLGTITPSDISLCRKDTALLVGQIFAAQNPYQWFKMLWEDGQDFSFEQEITFEPEQLASVVGGWEACANGVTIDPKDAYISDYLTENNAYEVVPDTRGSRMDSAKAMPAIEKALYSMEKQVDIEDTGCYNSARITADNVELCRVVEQVNSWLGASIHYNWYGTEFTVGQEQLSNWVSLQDGTPTLDEEAVREFVKEAKKQYDPYGHQYVFRTSLGVDLKLKCKSGWVTDPEKESEELIALIKEGAVTDKQPVSQTENYVFFDGTIGDSYAEVDLSNQHMYFYYKGELLLETDVVSGDMLTSHATPEGIYVVTFKQRDRILRGPGYESFVHFWMPFYGGYGMHDAMWRKAFGGSIFLENGSHGCVNLPLKKAETIYGCVEVGFPVVCYYYPQGKNPVENAALAAAGAAEAGNAGTTGANGELTGTGGTGAETGGVQTGTGTSGEDGERMEPGAQGTITEDNEIRGQW
ncbi:MAG: hypothetical protein E7295_09315 [Lachnospiraceae bacterium]|jgi:hypothetical protein|nr:hypothetical protein [Lachnospiraceae bacterium]